MLNEAKNRDPGLALTEIGFALYYSGIGDAEGVRRSLAAANRLDPLNIELADWGQWALAMVGEAGAAMAWAEEKMRQHPDVGVVYSGAAVAASLAGDHERAVELAMTGARLDDNSPISLITLAQIYVAAGQTDKIVPLLEEAGTSGDYMCPYESAVRLPSFGRPGPGVRPARRCRRLSLELPDFSAQRSAAGTHPPRSALCPVADPYRAG